jgi:hypothetical protein
MAANFYTGIVADSFTKEGGLSTQYLMADGSTTTSSGGSSPWTTDTYGITYTAGNVGIGMASGSTIDLVVAGAVRFYDELRVNGNVDMDGTLSVVGAIEAGDELTMGGNDILTEGGGIKDNNSSAGTNNQILGSKGSGNGIRWVDFPGLISTITGEPTGSSTISNIVQISKANYDAADTAGTLVTGTAYLIFA